MRIPLSGVLLHLVAKAACAGAMAAEPYPVRTVTLVVPTTPSGTIDSAARIFSDRLAARLGQSVVILNRPGAEGFIGMSYVAQQKPDGYTLLVNASSFNSGAIFRKTFTLDGISDFTPIVQLSYTRSFLVASGLAPFRNVKELIAYGRANPGKINVGTAASATTVSLPPIFKAIGVDVTMINYPGTNQITVAMLAGDVHLAYGGLAAWKAHIDSGKLRPLAVFAPRRFSLVPDVPTVPEAFPGASVFEGGIGVSGPKGLPRPIVDRLNAEFNAILADPAVRDRIVHGGGGDPGGGSPEDWRRFQEAEFQGYKRAAEAIGVVPQ